MIKVLQCVRMNTYHPKIPFGTIGTVVEILNDNFYLIEFCDDAGIPLIDEIVIALKESDLILI